MNSSVERRGKLGLWSIPGIGTQSFAKVLSSVSAEELLNNPVNEWLHRCDISKPAREALFKAKSLEICARRVEAIVERLGQRVIFPHEPDWPERFDGLADMPPMLFTKGTASLQPRRRLAIVGTRHPETGVLERVEDFAHQLALEGVCIVSGAAEGVDQSAHLGALAASGETWAFLGSSIESAGTSQIQFHEQILAGQGQIFTEFPPQTRPATFTFPRRNRLISGASDAVLVFRAGLDSGALYTANFAREQGRPVLAIPGETWAEHAAGCNRLIQTGRATLCQSPADALEALGLKGQLLKPEKTLEAQEFSPDAMRILQLLKKHPVGFDEVCACAAPLSSGIVAAALLELELSGVAIQRAGRRYEKL
jgi:DNA processing protein